MLHKLINNLGRFTSLACVWSTYPCGGNKGDYLTVGHKTYIWSDEQHNWILNTYANTDSYALLHQTGDLMLMGDLNVGGRSVTIQKAVFKDDVIVEGQLVCRHIKGKDKGLFASFDDLNNTVPAPHPGDWALVGTSANPQLWTATANRQWQLAGNVALTDSFNLDGYNAACSIVGDIAALGYVFGGVADTSTNPHTPRDYNVMYLTSQPGRYTNFDNIQVRFLSALMWHHDPNLAKGGYWTAHAIYTSAHGDGDAGVKSVTINSGEKNYPDSEGNVNLVIEQSPEPPSPSGDISGYIAQIEENTTNISALQNAMEDIDILDPLSPEYYGAVPDGIDLWNRPLRCYRNDVEDVEDNGYFDVEIPLPDCYIPYPEQWGAPGDIVKELVPEYRPTCTIDGETVHLNTNIIFYDTAKALFMLYIGGQYYSSWKNSFEWNNSAKARLDCVYCRTFDRSTFLFDGNAMVNIMDTDGNGTPLMTDNREAFVRCLKANNGSMRLSPGKIYFCTVTEDAKTPAWRTGTNNPMHGHDGFEIDGRGATIYVRSIYNGVDSYGDTPSSTTFMWMHNCKNGTVKNLSIKALRDRSDLAATTAYLRYSASDSRIKAFHLALCGNIVFENIEFLNMRQDFELKNTDDDFTQENWNHNISISRCKSRGVCNNTIAYSDEIRIDRCDVEGYPYIGGGCHLIYGQTALNKIFITNSVFKQGGPITEVALTFHGSPNCNLTMENCTVDCKAWTGAYNAVTHKQKFINCTFRQSWVTQYDSGRVTSVTKPLVLQPAPHYEFINCHLTTNPKLLSSTGYMVERGGNGNANTPSQVIFKGCTMVATDTDRLNNFFSWNGENYNLTVEGCTFKSSRATAKIGLTASGRVTLSNNTVLLCSTIDKDYLTKLVEELSGHPSEVPKYSAAPETAAVGDYYYNTVYSKFYRCTALSGATPTWTESKSLAARVAALE